MANRRVPLPVKITEEAMARTDRARAIMARKAGVPVSRTAFVDRALEDLAKKIEADEFKAEALGSFGANDSASKR